jgi:hypothetical protein
MSANDYSSTVQNLSDSMSGIKLADILQHIELPEETPPGFDHLSAANDELLKYGLPPPPDREHFPEQYRQWEKIFSQPLGRAPSTVEAVNRSSAPPPVQLTLSQTNEDCNSQDTNWCGAINSDLPDGYKFKTVSASWTVPRPCPPSSMKTNSGWDSGTFSADIWIGIGYGQCILRAGMTQRCVTSGDGAMQIVTIPWISWSPWYRVEISGFFINPGDLVNGCDRRSLVISRFRPFAQHYRLLLQQIDLYLLQRSGRTSRCDLPPKWQCPVDYRTP